MTTKPHKPEPTRSGRKKWRWPAQLFNGRVRTSTVVLIIAFVAVWWVYESYKQEPTPPAAPQVVPPGFIPDPAYTWVPRTRLQQPPVTVTVTTPPTPTTTESPEPPPSEMPSETPTPVPGFPFCPPLCPPPAPPAPVPAEQVPPSSPEPPHPPAPPGAPQQPSPPAPSSTAHPPAP